MKRIDHVGQAISRALESNEPDTVLCAEHYIVVNCGVRNPYLRRFYETRKLYF